MIEITSKAQFMDEIVNDLVFADFYADWCGPCRMLTPIMHELAEENVQNNIKFLKINVDENPDLAAQYGIVSIPTVIVFKDGEIMQTMTGVNPKEIYQQIINETL
ncbi:thioredoxin [candidate division SR1 bacterium]|nr:thioredoxin [candidate division SR1 bacterium]